MPDDTITISVAAADRCYARSNAVHWRVGRHRFVEALDASVAKAFAGRTAFSGEADAYCATLHLEDLALACACADGDEAAWQHFITTFRPLLYRAAAAIDHSGGSRDLADSLYADLYGLGARGARRQSLFRYFHGRSSLATWLRAVLAQRHVDRWRQRAAADPLPDDDGPGALAAPASVPQPDRDRLLWLMQVALAAALAALSATERLRLACYYAQQMTLAQIGRLTGEHESTVSRQLARTRAAIRASVEHQLRTQAGLSDGDIDACFSTVADDPGPLDLDALLGPAASGKEPALDRSTWGTGT